MGGPIIGIPAIKSTTCHAHTPTLKKPNKLPTMTDVIAPTHSPVSFPLGSVLHPSGGKWVKKKARGKEQRVCPSLHLVRKPIKPGRTNLARSAYHRRSRHSRSHSATLRPRRIPYCEARMARRWNDQGGGHSHYDPGHLPSVPEAVRQTS